MGLRSALPAAACVVLMAACGHEWDSFDPRLAGSGGSASASSASGGASTSTMATGSSAGGDGGAGATGGFGTAGMGGGAAGGAGGIGVGGVGGSGGGVVGNGDCASPLSAPDPSTQQGDTTGEGDEVDPSCAVSGAEDLVYEVIPAFTGILDIVLTSDADLVIHVRTDCDDSGTEIDCEDDEGTFAVETEKVAVMQGQPVYVIVDGYEPGRRAPFTLEVSTHPLVCGDDIVDPGEACDPPDGISCDPNCDPYPESCGDGADNDLDGLADCEDTGDCSCALGPQCSGAPALGPSAAGDTANGTGDFAGSCVGDDLVPEALFTYAPTQTGALLLTWSSAEDLGVYVRTACVDPSSETFCVDEDGGGVDEEFALPVVAGETVTIFVDGFTPSDVGSFSLSSTFVASTEGEPNDDSSQAMAASGTVIGSSYPKGDEDWFAIAVPGPSSDLTVSVLDFGMGNCPDGLLESELQIYDTDGTTTLDYDDNSGPGDCSVSSVTGLSAGTYYVRLGSPSPFGFGGSFAYELEIVVN